MTEEIVRIYTKIILKTLFGEDVSYETVPFEDPQTGEQKVLPLHSALRRPLPDIVRMFYNPMRIFFK